MASTPSYWWRTGFIGACFILGSLCWSVFSSVGGPSRVSKPNVREFVDVGIPKVHFSPAEVVTLQVQALRDSITTPERLKVCYSLASPKNREVTGPFARFSQMVMMPPYDRLTTSQDWQVGNATIENDYAAVLVSTVSENGDATAFRFMLRQWDDAPYRGCWLTEAVQVLEQVSTSEEINKTTAPVKETLLD